MSVFLSIIIILLVFSVLALVHEWGHYITARIFKVRIIEFSVFMGPKILQHKSKKTGTLYTLRLLPIGGYCSFPDDIQQKDGKSDENEEKIEFKEEETLSGQVWWKRAIIYSAGVFMNIVLALLISVIMIFSTGFSSSIVDKIDDESLAKVIGIEEGDKLVKFNGIGISNYSDYTVAQMGIKDKNPDENVMDSHYGMTYKKANGSLSVYDVVKHLESKQDGEEYQVASWKYTIKRTFEGKESTFEYFADFIEINADETALTCDVKLIVDGSVIKEGREDVKAQNFQTIGNSEYKIIKAKNPLKAVAYGFIDMVSWVKSVYISLFWLVNGTLGMDALSGPIGITSVVNDVVNIDGVAGIYKFVTLIYLAGLISANLAVMNFLPFPGLDGFFIVLVLFEIISGGRKMPTKVQNIISYVGLGLLILLAVFVAFMDISKLV